MSEAEFCLTPFFQDFEDHRCALPFSFITREIEIVIQNEPNDFLARNELRYPQLATMDILVSICELRPESVGPSLNLLRPPSTNVLNGIEDVTWGLIHCKSRGGTLFCHDSRVPFVVRFLNRFWPPAVSSSGGMVSSLYLFLWHRRTKRPKRVPMQSGPDQNGMSAALPQTA